MGCSASRVDKIISAFRKNNFDKVIQLCNFNDKKIDEHSITPFEIAEIIHIFKTEYGDYDYMISSNNNKFSKFRYEPLLMNEKNMDYVSFMIINVCYKMSCARFIPVMIELLFKEKVDDFYIEGFVKNLNSSRFDIGCVHANIITYLCFNTRPILTNQQLYKLLLLLKEKCDVHLNVNPALSIYKDDQLMKHGNSILMTLAKRNYIPLIQLLLNDGADYKQVNKYGLTYYDHLSDNLKNHFRNYNPYGDESTA